MNTQRPVRIMRIIARLNVGGPAIHVILLTERLSPPEFESLLVTGQIGPHEGDMRYLAEERGVQPVYVPQLGRSLSPLRDIITLFKLWRLMRRFRPDIVHTHTAKAGFVGRIAAWLAGVPVRVHTFHGHVLHGYFSPGKTWLFLQLERFTACLSDRLITLSDSLKSELSQTYRVAPANKFEVVPLGLELQPLATTPRHTGEFRARHNILPETPLIGIVGRIVPVKNHVLFVRMAEELHHSMPDARFAIIGDGESRAEIEALVRASDLQDLIIFAGWIDDLRPVYSDLDVLVMTSRNEGTPVSVIEALAAGVPVVSTAVGGVPDLLHNGDFGRLVPSEDAAALAQAVTATLTDSTADRAAIRQTVLRQYDISRLADDLASLYRDLLAAESRKRRP